MTRAIAIVATATLLLAGTWAVSSELEWVAPTLRLADGPELVAQVPRLPGFSTNDGPALIDFPDGLPGLSPPPPRTMPGPRSLIGPPSPVTEPTLNVLESIPAPIPEPRSRSESPFREELPDTPIPGAMPPVTTDISVKSDTASQRLEPAQPTTQATPTPISHAGCGGSCSMSQTCVSGGQACSRGGGSIGDQLSRLLDCQPIGPPRRLISLPLLNHLNIEAGGWIDQGVTLSNRANPDRYNGVVTFNDRDGEYQCNQAWLHLERPTRRDGGFDLGGRIDLMFGSDARFTQATDGLEATWGQQGLHQAALPQCYLDLVAGAWKVRMGHFFTMLGYEGVPAVDNFFYSHSYAMQYAEPFTHTGILFMRDVGPFSLTAGLQRGNNQVDDTDGHNAAGFLGAVSWTGPYDDLAWDCAVSATEQGPAIDQTMYSVVLTWALTDRFSWILQHDGGQTFDHNLGQKAEWYGVNQYFLYQINPCWQAALRYEWFRDDDGTRVRGLGAGNRNTGPYVGSFHGLTVGMNWRPASNVTVRPELRWDWYDGDATPSPIEPFDAGRNPNQFLFGCDLVATF